MAQSSLRYAPKFISCKTRASAIYSGRHRNSTPADNAVVEAPIGEFWRAIRLNSSMSALDGAIASADLVASVPISRSLIYSQAPECGLRFSVKAALSLEQIEHIMELASLPRPLTGNTPRNRTGRQEPVQPPPAPTLAGLVLARSPCQFRHQLVGVVWLLVTVCFLPVRQFHLLARRILIGNLLQ